MSTTHSYRRATFATPPPIAGSFILSKSGKSTLLVEKSTVFRRSGEAVSRDTIRLQVTKVALPADAIVLPWPIAAKVVPTPPVPAAVAFHAAVAHATAASTSPKSRKQMKRDNARTLQARMDDIESPVPKRQRTPVMDSSGHPAVDAEGKVIWPPRVVSGSWKDPDDTNVRSRTPRLSHGFKPYDPIQVLARVNPSVEVAHVVASDCYRLAFEKGPAAGVSGGRELVFSDRSYGNGQGVTDAKCDNMAAWNYVQAKFLPREQQALQVVVLDRTAVSTWADAIDGNRQKWIGFLVCVLDRLLSIYRDDVDSFLSQERVSLD
jgi:hypothetical protein